MGAFQKSRADGGARNALIEASERASAFQNVLGRSSVLEGCSVAT
jgi:hypothetical protein